MKRIIQDLTPEEIGDLCASTGEPAYRARQLYLGLMQGRDISEIDVLPGAMRSRLTEEFEDSALTVVKTLTAADGTEKYLFRLSDGNIIEGVLMRYSYGATQCVSTQVGCRMGCSFCASTQGGLIRNLTSGEILSQVLKVNRMHGGTADRRAVTNIVLMGSGEPLDNYGEVVRFLRAVTREGGICVSPRNISLSTCGIVPRMRSLADEGIPVNLTVSLHEVTDEGRARTMPVARSYRIEDILSACSYYFDKTGRRYIFEYALIEGQNSDREHAEALVRLLKGRPCHVNLIRLNDVKGKNMRGESEMGAREFLSVLTEGGLSATVRRSTGADIGGACGQLRAGYLEGEL